MLPLCPACELAWLRYAASWSFRLLNLLESPHMADLFFLALGGGAFVLFAVLASALRRV